jgi:hypothetical protein
MSQEVKPGLSEFSAEEAELARQLFNLRRPPSPALVRRVQALPQSAARSGRALSPRLLGGVAMLLVMGLLFISPPVQATLDEMQQVIGGQIHLTIRTVWPKPTETVVMLEAEPMSLAEAQAILPFIVATPAYLPKTLTLSDDQVLVTQSPLPMAKMTWRDAAGGFVQLSIYSSGQESQLSQTVVGPDSSEPVLINGREAVLVRGGWDEQSRTWSHQAQVTTLIWTVNKVRYRLLSYSDAVSLPELIAVAESIR